MQIFIIALISAYCLNAAGVSRDMKIKFEYPTGEIDEKIQGGIPIQISTDETFSRAVQYQLVKVSQKWWQWDRVVITLKERDNLFEINRE